MENLINGGSISDERLVIQFHHFFLSEQLYEKKTNPIDLPSSTHISPSSMSFNPVGQAHDIRGLLSVIFGAGKHR